MDKVVEYSIKISAAVSKSPVTCGCDEYEIWDTAEKLFETINSSQLDIFSPKAKGNDSNESHLTDKPCGRRQKQRTVVGAKSFMFREKNRKYVASLEETAKNLQRDNAAHKEHIESLKANAKSLISEINSLKESLENREDLYKFINSRHINDLAQMQRIVEEEDDEDL